METTPPTSQDGTVVNEALAKVRGAVMRIPLSPTAQDAAATALTVLSDLGQSTSSAIVLANVGAHLDERLPQGLRQIAGDMEPPPELRHLPEGERLTGPMSLDADRWVLEFRTPLGDRGWAVFLAPQAREDLFAWADVVLGPLGGALGALARREGWVEPDGLPVEPVDAITALRRHLQFGSRCDLPTTVLALGFDSAESVRMRYGRAAAEHLGRAVTRRIVRALRGTDAVHTLGGDERVAILPATPLAGGLHVGSELCARIAELRVEFEGHELATSLSVGVSPTEMNELNPRVSLARARQALTEAQRAGGNRVVQAPQAPPTPSRAN